jgi:hypothetical protein
MSVPPHRPDRPDRPDPRRIPDLPDPALPETIQDLTLRIEMAELRVVRRDLEFQLHWDSLRQRGKAVMVPSRWLLPALGTGASWLFWRLVRGRRHRHERHERHERRERVDAHRPDGGRDAQAARGQDAERPELGMLQLLTVLWGFAPASLRGRVGPELTQLLLGVVAGFLHGRKQRREEGAGQAAERAQRAGQDRPAAP